VTTLDDLSGPALALYSEATGSGDPAGYLNTAAGWSVEDRLLVAAVLDVNPGDLIAAIRAEEEVTA